MGFEGTAAEWNRDNPVGTPVFWMERPFGRGARKRTASPARSVEFGAHVLQVVELEGVSHAVPLDQMSPDETAMAESIPARTGAASGRQARGDAAVMAAAYELASLARRLATRVANGVGTTLGEEFAAHRDEVVRILALSSSIEGTVLGGGAPQVVGTRVYLQDLVPKGIYVTHFLGRDLEWAFVAPSRDGFLVMDKGSGNVVENGADHGLCPYGLNGAWHPNVWTEAVGASTMDGRALAERVDRDSEAVEVDLPDDEGGQ